MNSLMTLLSVLVPMFAGFFIRVPKPYLSVLDRMLSVLVYAVLLLIGVSLARVENLGTQLDDIALTTLWLFFCTVGTNLIVLAVLGRCVRQCEAARMRGSRFCVRQIDARYLDAV